MKGRSRRWSVGKPLAGIAKKKKKVVPPRSVETASELVSKVRASPPGLACQASYAPRLHLLPNHVRRGRGCACPRPCPGPCTGLLRKARARPGVQRWARPPTPRASADSYVGGAGGTHPSCPKAGPGAILPHHVHAPSRPRARQRGAGQGGPARAGLDRPVPLPGTRMHAYVFDHSPS